MKVLEMKNNAIKLIDDFIERVENQGGDDGHMLTRRLNEINCLRFQAYGALEMAYKVGALTYEEQMEQLKKFENAKEKVIQDVEKHK
ncbi:hypothetical protein J7620_10040 [Wohlfahrtiimonas chitiniclastica]|uniref:hypothetical protein n=1 Tax=Wohlfahrtiimonas chitiniclastica TaxID=400946 RepID=UPI001BCCE350|nr:hypothetical protein [Wohlfahrtiimonas chitiniclastica]MBS7835280.1 hypothetical protein [Wohlfahrtiimonas chitiniclastica]